MKPKNKRIAIGAITGIVGIIVIAVALGGCLEGRDIQTIKVSGSTTVLPIVQRTAEAYMDKHPNVDIRVSGGGSSVGIESAGKGLVDIGMSSRELKSKEKEQYPNLREIAIGKDALAIILHPSNPVTNLTLKEIKGIYNGTYKNWKDFGWSDKPIVVVKRDIASGTGEFFWERVMGKENITEGALEKPSNAAIKETVKNTPGAIGYVGLGFVDETVKAIKIDVEGTLVEASKENVLNGKYPIARPLYLVTNGEPTGLTKDFIDFILSEEGQKLVEKEGFIPVQ